MIRYVLKYSEYANKNSIDKYVALDDSSGGYPYAVEIHQAKTWATAEEAENYSKMFKGEMFQVVGLNYKVITLGGT